MTALFTETQSTRLLLAILVVFRFLLCHSQRWKTLRNLSGFFPTVHQGFILLLMFILRTWNTLQKKKHLLILFLYLFHDWRIKHSHSCLGFSINSLASCLLYFWLMNWILNLKEILTWITFVVYFQTPNLAGYISTRSWSSNKKFDFLLNALTWFHARRYLSKTRPLFMPVQAREGVTYNLPQIINNILFFIKWSICC